MRDFAFKMHQIQFRLGLRPRPRWGSSQRSHRPPSCIWGREGERGRENGKGREGGREGGGDGKGGEGKRFRLGRLGLQYLLGGLDATGGI